MPRLSNGDIKMPKKTKKGKKTTTSEQRFTTLVDGIIIENQQTPDQIKNYKKNRRIYILAIASVLLIFAITVSVILAIIFS
ncbi:hypothetical protein [Mycoplasma nasistruthionis]|uniref:Uncharacterized protein n=1 Tax=Mycoplasma nasistruthionis TaxID=353852 RepID=A0A4Y6I5L8_9MOLU|nr:hypothetical protein [Mycoplasma nasistruthionis]QCZ36618.1 hypothetical protein FG904_01115 [Mycoplasma nasistruthionis]QDF64915.1 hypothetical protein FIV53_01140 [Mycoplasma nasistruthionis]